MEDIFRVSDYGYEHLTELTLDGLLTPLTETTWVRSGAVLDAEDRIHALAAQIPARLVVSHATAWWVHLGLGRAPSPLTLTTHPRRRVLEQNGLIVHELNLARSEWETIAGVPVTTPMRTLYDLLLPHVRSPRPVRSARSPNSSTRSRKPSASGSVSTSTVSRAGRSPRRCVRSSNGSPTPDPRSLRCASLSRRRCGRRRRRLRPCALRRARCRGGWHRTSRRRTSTVRRGPSRWPQRRRGC